MPRSASRRDEAFAGFGPKALDWLRALAFHQSKDWFEANRALYDSQIREPLVRLVTDLTTRFAEERIPLKGEPKTAIFRLHRDTRFAKDKRPYKTNAGAVMTRDGAKWTPGLFYVHLDPEGCFAAAGFYHPEPNVLAAIRRRIVDEPAAYRNAVAAMGEAGLTLSDAEALKRLPRGFETVTEPDLVEAVKLRSLVTRRPIPPEALRRPDLVDTLMRFACDAEPLLRFGWSVVDALPPG